MLRSAQMWNGLWKMWFFSNSTVLLLWMTPQNLTVTRFILTTIYNLQWNLEKYTQLHDMITSVFFMCEGICLLLWLIYTQRWREIFNTSFFNCGCSVTSLFFWVWWKTDFHKSGRSMTPQIVSLLLLASAQPTWYQPETGCVIELRWLWTASVSNYS